MDTFYGAESLLTGFYRVCSRSRRGMLITLAVSLLSAFTLTASASGPGGGANGHSDRGGLVYAMTNDSDGNEIVVFKRDRRGRLGPLPRATVSTGGLGGSVTAAIDPLGSQGSLIYDETHDMLFAVNAGDDTVTAFGTAFFGLPYRWNRIVVPSGGQIPVSLAVLEDRLYVLNAGGTGSVATFEIGRWNDLSLIDVYDLGLTGAYGTTPPFNQVMAPGQVGIDALGRNLIVTHAGGGEVLVVALDDAAVPTGPAVSTPSPGIVPFAFVVTPYGSTLVAEAGSGSVSAFDPPANGNPMTVTAATVATGQAATCWIAVHPSGFAYVSNTGSNTLSLYEYTRTGGLTLLDDVAAEASGAPIDLTLANGGGFIYSLDAASGQISGFAVNTETGALTHVDTQGGLAPSAGIQGIAARDF